jgi:hypothetical protein
VNAVDAATRHGWRAGALLAEGTFEDPTNARVIYIAAGGLLLLALLLGVGTWWWWRSAKVEHPALGPLEVMGSRTWRKGDFNNRVKTIEQARPANAIHEAELAEPDELDVEAIDLAAMSRAEPAHFGDFSDLLPAQPAAEAVAADAAGEVASTDVPEEGALAASADPVAEEPASEPVSSEPVSESESESESASAPDAPEVDATPSREPVPEPDPVALQLAFDEPLAESASGPIDPLLRLNTGE